MHPSGDGPQKAESMIDNSHQRLLLPEDEYYYISCFRSSLFEVLMEHVR